MKKYHNIENIHFQNDIMFISIDGNDYQFELSTYSSKLHNASVEQKVEYDISPSGYRIHWPLIDEDLSIDEKLYVLLLIVCGFVLVEARKTGGPRKQFNFDDPLSGRSHVGIKIIYLHTRWPRLTPAMSNDSSKSRSKADGQAER